jgi:cytochrome c553
MKVMRSRSDLPGRWLWAAALAAVLITVTAARAAEPPGRPSWSDLIPDKIQPPNPVKGPRHIPGSARSYTATQIDDGSNPPDWFPAAHPPAPQMVAHGHPPAVPGCALCHLYSGQGHPESANLAGQPAGYLARQMADFKSGARVDPARMTAIGRATSDEDAKLAATWFASLTPVAWFKVVESDQVPRTWITPDHLRLRRPEGGIEPLGRRIVEFADDTELARDRDPDSGFTTYVPVGSIASGKHLAETGAEGRSVTCIACHGQQLEGMGEVPRIAGLSAVYVAHQLAAFRGNGRTGPVADPMRVVAAKLTQDDILSLAAYLVSLEPQGPKR